MSETEHFLLEAIRELRAENANMKSVLNDPAVWFRDLARVTADEIKRLQAENERLTELLRGVGANRYWEGRWRDEHADNARLTELVARLRAEIELVSK